MELNCRECPKAVRDRCIQACNQAPSVKLMMLRAFEAGTDTREMWGRLQMNCLLLKGEEVRPRRSSLLSRRLRKKTELAEEATPVVSELERVSPSPSKAKSSVRRTEEGEAAVVSVHYCLELQNGHHRIALPRQGEIVIGRFDLATNAAPDVDLSYDDREHYAISRRHARVIGQGGIHKIEDMGSTNGTKVNGVRLGIGQKVSLHMRDRVALGYCEFVYGTLPDVPTALHASLPPASLRVLFTGQWFPLPNWGELVIGRSDLVVGFVPDVDLSDAGEAAQVVARRHVNVVARGGRHYVEDLGSANGTKINGIQMRLGELRMLSPGDHLWLGGCVLAYDVAE